MKLNMRNQLIYTMKAMVTFLVSALTGVESKALVAMRLNVKVHDSLAQSVQGELNISD
jgi:hypothetical protein